MGAQSAGLAKHTQLAGSAERTQSAWWGVRIQWVAVAEGTVLVGKGREHSISEEGSVSTISGVHGVRRVGGDGSAHTIGMVIGVHTVSGFGCVHTVSGDGGACTVGQVG